MIGQELASRDFFDADWKQVDTPPYFHRTTDGGSR